MTQNRSTEFHEADCAVNNDSECSCRTSRQPKQPSANAVWASKILRSNQWCGHISIEGEPPREVGCILPIGHDENVHEETIVLSMKVDGTHLLARVERDRTETCSCVMPEGEAGDRCTYCGYVVR